ncbi:MAG TPA: MFS transporter [Gaiellaceae bacterium]|nr:MFS transporter [Gaiellaceae bacterium]
MSSSRGGYATLATVFRNRELRLLEIAWAGSVIGHYGFQIALGVWAYEVGGAAAVGAVFLLRTLGALATPPAAALGDRYPRVRVMFASDFIRALLVLGTLLAIVSDSPSGVVYVLAGLAAAVGTAFRPAQVALLPQLARTPEELTMANVVATTIEGLGMFVGPALAGLVLAVSGIEATLVVMAVALLWSAALVLPIHEAPLAPGHGGHPPFREFLLAGFGVTWRNRELRVLTGVLSGQALTAGCINVLIVVTALSLLELGEGGVGLLDAAVGMGALLGAVAIVPLVSRTRLTAPLLAGALLWGLPLVAIAVWPTAGVAVAALALVGVGNTLVDVAGFTLLQRIAPEDVLARVFGVVETLFYLAIGLGSLLAPLLVETAGTRWALVAVGLFLPLVVVALSRRIVSIDAGADVPLHELELLRLLPMFAPLPQLALERVARQVVPVTAEEGTEVITQGDEGDRFYAIDVGECEVLVDGLPVATLGRGDGFGEIALLRDQPRMATVVARTPVTLYALEREAFLAAVTGHSESEEAADALIVSRLSSVRG